MREFFASKEAAALRRGLYFFTGKNTIPTDYFLRMVRRLCTMLVQPVLEGFFPFLLLVLDKRNLLVEVYAQAYEREGNRRNPSYTA